MTKYEYMILPVINSGLFAVCDEETDLYKSDAEKLLNRFGNDGWKVNNVIDQGGIVTFLMERTRE